MFSLASLATLSLCEGLIFTVIKSFDMASCFFMPKKTPAIQAGVFLLVKVAVSDV